MRNLGKDAWTKLERILCHAIELNGDERERYLALACEGDSDLRRDVDALLAADAAAGAFLEQPAELPIEAIADAATAQPQRVGPYRILRELGHGGMGAVYLAERDDGQFEQQVAVKLVSTAQSEALLKRFIRERQILARLDHPNIARLYDGGITENRIPYFVMEYVEGSPITEYCDSAELGVDERIDLFLQVCEGVKYANAHLVVHRDLKPGNIMVTKSGHAKLLDFGIAKVLSPEPDEEPGEADTTETGSRFFTPQYASPEQLQGQGVTTASDVYALGLVLYELLSGERAFGEVALTPQERLHVMLETEPTAPSRIGPSGLRAKLAGELDAICSKALRAEPEQRYSSAEALGEDLIRYRAHQPVRALRGSIAYRFKKSLRRNRGVVIAGALIASSLAAGAMLSLRQAQLAELERDRAVEAEARARAVNDFVVRDMLESATSEASRGEETTVLDAMLTASRRVEGSFPDQPELEAAVQLALGSSFLSLADHERARVHLEESVALRTRTLGELHPETLQARSVLGATVMELGNLGEAEQVLEQVLASQLEILGEDTLDALITEGRLAELRYRRSDYLGAEASYRTVVERMERLHESSWRERAHLSTRFAQVLEAQRKPEESEPVLRKVLELQQRNLGREHPEVFRTTALLAETLLRDERVVEGRALLDVAVDGQERILGENHPETLRTLENIVRAYWDDEPRRAEEIQRDILERARKALGDDHRVTKIAVMNLGVIESAFGNHDRAEVLSREAVETSRRLDGDEHYQTFRARRQLARTLLAAGLEAEARATFREIIEIGKRVASDPSADATYLADFAWLLMTYPPEDMHDPQLALSLAERAVARTERRHADFLDTLSLAYERVGDLDRAVSLRREVFALDGSITFYEGRMVELLEKQGDTAGIEEFLAYNLERRKRSRPEDDFRIGWTLELLAIHHHKQGRLADAERGFRDALAQYRKRLPEEHSYVSRTTRELSELLVENEDLEGAEEVLLEAYKALDDDKERAVTIGLLVRLYEAWGKAKEAQTWRAKTVP